MTEKQSKATTETKVELGAVQPPEKKKRGPGRPPKSKTQRIREMIAAGASSKHVADKLGVSPQQVYQVRYADKKKELASKRYPRPIKQFEFPPAPVKNEGAQIPYVPYDTIHVHTPLKPTFWQRVKAVFFPN